LGLKARGQPRDGRLAMASASERRLRVAERPKRRFRSSDEARSWHSRAIHLLILRHQTFTSCSLRAKMKALTLDKCTRRLRAPLSISARAFDAHYQASSFFSFLLFSLSLSLSLFFSIRPPDISARLLDRAPTDRRPKLPVFF